MKQYLLVTTAIQETFSTQKSLLLLGKWCLRPSLTVLLNESDYKITTYHWDDRTKLQKDYEYLSNVYKKFLKAFVIKLNELHGVNFSERYWNILIGPWLRNFIHALFDRWSSINNVIVKYENIETKLINFDTASLVPHDTAEFIQNIMFDDPWNHYMYGEILKFLKCSSIKKINIPERLSQATALKLPSRGLALEKSKPSFRARASSLASKILGVFASKNNYFFHGSDLTKIDQWILEISLGCLPSHFKSNNLDRNSCQKNTREPKSLNLEIETQFENFLSQIIYSHVPQIFIEGYSDLRKSLLNSTWPKNPKIIFTSNSFDSDDYFKIWAAEKIFNGSKLVISQHGGLYGSGFIISMEDHEVKISDKYFSWGWEKKGTDKVLAMPSGKLKYLSRRLKNNPHGDLVLIGNTIPRYSYQLHSAYISSQYKSHEQDQFAFINTLKKEIKEQLRIRNKQDAYGWDRKVAFQQNIDDPVFDSIKTPFYESVSDSRLCIICTNFTSHLETFAANIPTVIFWDPKYNELRPEAEPFFDKLVDAGILFYDPVAAAKQVNSIWSDVPGWWNQEKVQDAKDVFAYNFARVSDNWLQEWCKTLKEV